jgi:hypothetical protein
VRRPLRLTLAVATLVAVTGCATGPRPTLSDDTPLGGAAGEPVGDAAVDAVLTRLEGAPATPFTARYALLRRLGPLEASGTVVADGATVSTTVGDVRFVSGDDARTCRVSTGSCEDGLLDQRISDTGVGSAFWAGGPARALRVSFLRRSGPPAPSSTLLAGRTVQCVDVPVGPGVETYCAADEGVVALWDTADKRVELTELTGTADPAAFTP